MDSVRADVQKTEGLGGRDEGLQVIQKDNTTTPSVDLASDEDRQDKKGSNMNSSESRVRLGYVDDEFIRQLVPS